AVVVPGAVGRTVVYLDVADRPALHRLPAGRAGQRGAPAAGVAEGPRDPPLEGGGRLVGVAAERRLDGGGGVRAEPEAAAPEAGAERDVLPLLDGERLGAARAGCVRHAPLYGRASGQGRRRPVLDRGRDAGARRARDEGGP